MTMNDIFDGINNRDQLTALMARLGTDGQARTVQVIFGAAFVTSYDSPSQIPYHAVGHTSWPSDLRGYWQGGKLHRFSAKLTRDYVNSCYSDRG
jgi:hypothetical protein